MVGAKPRSERRSNVVLFAQVRVLVDPSAMIAPERERVWARRMTIL
ncbi:MAG: hypothetical protein KC420_01335 [Myxococcales bacterium]|nr:hypothetical protein [Myxococcales bacterium]MCB9566060.1 hypothetical protein [Myxococcales bacterium]MCB9703915.1 hypothetical protein [Myxococcales bacterium]